jgi:hypothetical protein
MGTQPESSIADTTRHAISSEVEIALLDVAGTIVRVNEAWERFARENGGDPARTGVGSSFLDACDAADGDPVAALAAAAIRAALDGQLPAPLSMVIPCHSPTAQRWFDVLVSPRFSEEHILDGATVVLSPREPPVEERHTFGPPRGMPEERALAPTGWGDSTGRQREPVAQAIERTVPSLFSVGLQLQQLASQTRDPGLRHQLEAGVDTIDEVILDLRDTMFDHRE